MALSNESRKDTRQIEEALFEAHRKLQVGSTWRHLRSGVRYMVRGFSVHEKTLAVHVLYQAQSPIVWSRPIREFLDGRFIMLEDGLYSDSGA